MTWDERIHRGETVLTDESLAGRELTYLEAIRDAMRYELRRDPAVLLMGEDIGVYGGAFKVTQGLIVFTSEKPRCWIAALRISTSCFCFEEKRWATKVAPVAIAICNGRTGCSIEPDGVERVSKPSIEVGDTWPLVRP